jgi:type IV pilus assembly protein PilB
MEERVRLGDMLVEANLLTEEQLKMAANFQKEVGGKLGAIIVKLGFIEDQTLINFIGRQQGLPVVNLDELVLPENLVKRIPRKLIEKHHVIPIRFGRNVLTVATSDPFDYEAIEELQLALSDTKIEMHLAPRSQILKCINDLFYREEESRRPPEKSKEDLLREMDDEERHVATEKVSPALLREALIPLLLEKGVITKEELARKAREIESAREREAAK